MDTIVPIEPFLTSQEIDDFSGTDKQGHNSIKFDSTDIKSESITVPCLYGSKNIVADPTSLRGKSSYGKRLFFNNPVTPSLTDTKSTRKGDTFSKSSVFPSSAADAKTISSKNKKPPKCILDDAGVPKITYSEPPKPIRNIGDGNMCTLHKCGNCGSTVDSTSGYGCTKSTLQHCNRIRSAGLPYTISVSKPPKESRLCPLHDGDIETTHDIVSYNQLSSVSESPFASKGQVGMKLWFCPGCNDKNSTSRICDKCTLTGESNTENLSPGFQFEECSSSLFDDKELCSLMNENSLNCSNVKVPSQNNNSEMLYPETTLLFLYQSRIKNNLDFNLSILKRYEYDRNPFSYIRCYYMDQSTNKTTCSQLQIPLLISNNKSKIEQLLIDINNSSQSSFHSNAVNCNEACSCYLPELIDDAMTNGISGIVLSLYSLQYRWQAIKSYLNNKYSQSNQSTNQNNRHTSDASFSIHCNWLCDDLVSHSLSMRCDDFEISSIKMPHIDKILISLDATTNLLTSVALIPKSTGTCKCSPSRTGTAISSENQFVNTKVTNILKLLKMNANLYDIHRKDSRMKTPFVTVKSFQRKVLMLETDKVLFSFKLNAPHFDMQFYKPICEILLRETDNFQFHHDWISAKIFHRSLTPHKFQIDTENVLNYKNLSKHPSQVMMGDWINCSSESERSCIYSEFIYIDRICNHPFTRLSLNWTKENKHILLCERLCNISGRMISDIKLDLSDEALRQSLKIQTTEEIFHTETSEFYPNLNKLNYGFACEMGDIKVVNIKFTEDSKVLQFMQHTTLYFTCASQQNNLHETIMLLIPIIRNQNKDIIQSIYFLINTPLQEKRKESGDSFEPRNLTTCCPSCKPSQISSITCSMMSNGVNIHSLTMEIPKLYCHGFVLEKLDFSFQHALDNKLLSSYCIHLEKASRAKLSIKTINFSDQNDSEKSKIDCVWLLNGKKLSEIHLNLPLIQLPQVNKFVYEIKLLFSINSDY